MAKSCVIYLENLFSQYLSAAPWNTCRIDLCSLSEVHRSLVFSVFIYNTACLFTLSGFFRNTALCIHNHRKINRSISELKNPPPLLWLEEWSPCATCYKAISQHMHGVLPDWRAKMAASIISQMPSYSLIISQQFVMSHQPQEVSDSPRPFPTPNQPPYRFHRELASLTRNK